MQLYLFFIVAGAFLGKVDADCQNYISEDVWQRSTAYILDPKSQSSRCDLHLRSRWYRFTSKAGGTIPGTCPPVNSCGATASIWAEGDLPTAVGDIRDLKACIRVNNQCCHRSFNIKVEKCSENGGSFYSYFLHRPKGCMSYCAGNQIPCPSGSNSANGFTPGCSKKFPTIKSKPKVSPAVRNNRLEFKCEFESDETKPEQRYEVTWYQGAPAQRITHTTIVQGNQRVATFQNPKGLKKVFNLGTTISCRVKSFFSYSEKLRSAFSESNHFYAGLVVEPKNIRTSEGGKPVKLTVRTTVPIVCDNPLNCKLHVDIAQDNNDNYVTLCTIVFPAGPAGQEKSLDIVAKRDFVNDGSRKMHLKVTVLVTYDDWEGHKKIPDVQITTEDVQTAQCGSHGDPHLTTFDKRYYNHYQVGDYVAVKSNCRLFEVHVRTFQCGSVSCNCGIAVREGDDVVVVDMCRDRIPRARFASTVAPAEGTSLQRDNNGRRFVINLPSGASVKTDFTTWYMDYTVKVPSDDYKCTKGLCGNFDGNSANDFEQKNGNVGAVTAFTESWKLPVGDSLFYYKGGEQKCKAQRKKHYCTCEERAGKRPLVNCDMTSIANKPKYVQGTQGWKNLEFPGGRHCGRRRKRAISTDNVIMLPEDDGVSNYVYNPTPLILTAASWPTPSGKTQMYARSICTNAIKTSQFAVICGRITGFSLQPFIRQCVEDVQILDSDTFVISAVLAMQASCEEIFLKDMSYWQKSPAKNNTLQPPKDMGNTLCPGLCTGHGDCRQGACVCEADYTSLDCSIKKSEPPKIKSLPLSNLCDVRKRRDCNSVRIVGSNFDDSRLSCRIKTLSTRKSSPADTGKQSIRAAQLLSFAEILCDIPVKVNNNSKVTGTPYVAYLLAVSNDGIKFSTDSLMYTVYDSKCIDCSKDRTCKQKANTCLVNGHCFTTGEHNPDDAASVCDPTKYTKAFTKDCGRTYKLMGCYIGNETNMIYNGRPHIKWKNGFQAWAPDLACQCAKIARKKGFSGFALHFYGECYGKTDQELASYASATKSQDQCAGDETYIDCKASHEVCVGKPNSSAVYALK